MSTTVLAIILIAVVVLNAAFFWFVSVRKRNDDSGAGKNDAGLNLLLQQINELSRTVDAKIGETTRQVSDGMRSQFSESAKLIREVTQGLTKLDETNKQVVSFADQLQSLQDILKNPKQRGILGEYYLEALLKNVFPAGGYKMQYGFPDGTIVDAAVFVDKKVIPVDSKFSLENYNRMADEKDAARKAELSKLFENDLKLRIIETSKYIKPENNTMDFAFMFIPHEAIYYDLLVNKVGGEENLIQRAASKYKVIIVSPTSFLAYLQTVLQGLRAMHIEETAKDVIKRVGELGKHLKSFEEYHMKLGSALSTTVNHFNASGKEFKKIDKDVLRISGASADLESIAIEKPEIGE